MKFAPKQLILAGMLAAIGLTASAQTPPPPPAGAPAPGMMQREGHGRMDSEKMRARMQERMAKRMAALKQKLQITAAQEGAWNTFATALKPTSMQRPDRRQMRAEFQKMRPRRSTPHSRRNRRRRSTRSARACSSAAAIGATTAAVIACDPAGVASVGWGNQRAPHLFSFQCRYWNIARLRDCSAA